MSEKLVSEPEFLPAWYDLGVRSQDDEGELVGNQAYMDWMKRVLDAATARKIDWTQVELAIILDRQVQRDEARRALLDDPTEPGQVPEVQQPIRMPSGYRYSDGTVAR